MRVSPEGAGFASKLQAQLKGAGLANVGVLAGGAIAAGIVVGLSSIGAEFGKVRRIITQETGASAKEVEGLFSAVRTAADQVPVSLDKAAHAVDLLFKRGVPIGPLLDRLAKQELFLAKITGTDLASNVEQTTAIFAKFNVPLREQSKELDVLFKAQQRSGKGLAELLQPLQTGGAALQEFGFNLDKSAALIANLQAAGVNVQPALAALRRAFGQLAKEGKDPTQALADLIAEFKSGKDPAGAMADAMKLFGSRAGLELARAIKAGKFEVNDLLKIITDGKGGIVATGEATLTLADQFTLLRNRAVDNFAEIGTKVRTALVGVVIAASAPLERVAAAIGHLVTAAAPLALIFAPLTLAFRLVLPAVGAFATGLDAIASALDLLKNPAFAAGAAIAFVALEGLAIIQTLASAARAVQAFTATLLANPYFLVAAGIIAIGVAVQTFRARADPAIKISKQLSDALFTTDDATSIFANGLASATDALDKFFEAQTRGADKSFVKAILAGTGSTVDQLTAAVTGSKTAWDRYATSAIRALNASGASGIEVAALTEQLQGLRSGFALTASAQAAAAISTGVLTRSEKNAIVEQHRFKDGSVDLAGVLNDINTRLRHSAEAQDKVVLATASTRDTTRELAEELAAGTISAADAESAIGALGLSADAAATALQRVKDKAAEITASQDALTLSSLSTSKAYGQLARAIAEGTIGQIAATDQLDAMGLSATGAGTAFTDLQTQIKTFVDTALGALPSVSDAVQAFNQAVSGDKSTITSDLQKHVELQKQLARAGAKASDSLKNSIVDNNAAIKADFQKLADDANPKRFTDQLIANAQEIVGFTQNLRKLITAGLGSLAGDLAKLGPEQAGALAAALASDPAQAKVANAASILAGRATDSYQTFLKKNIGPLALTGEAAGRVIGKGITDGIIAELIARFPALRGLATESGGEINAGVKQGAAQGDITEGITESIRRAEGRFRASGVPLGVNAAEGAKAGASTVDVAAGIEAAIRRGGGKVRAAGVFLGGEAVGGITSGILAGFKPVGDAMLAVTQHGVSVARGAWRISSPSKVFMELGSQVGAGLALGISGSAKEVGQAAALLASDATSSVSDSISAATFNATFSPVITPTVAPVVLPPLPPATVQVLPALAPLDPVELAATFGPVKPPLVPATTVDANVVTHLPPFDPVALSGVFAPVAPPVVPALTLDATFGPIPVPAIPPVPQIPLTGVLSATAPTFDAIPLTGDLGPVAPPTFDPLTLSAALGPVQPPTFDPIAFTGSLGPVAPPVFEPLVLAAHVGDVTPPSFEPIVLDASLTPVPPPAFDPITLDAHVGRVSPPTFAAVTLAASLDVTKPTFDPVLLDAALKPLQIPDLAPIPASLDLAKPVIPSVVVPSALAPFPVPRVSPVVAPLVIPPLPPLPVTTQVAPIVLPPIPRPAIEITPTLAPLPPLELAATVNPPVVPQPPPLNLDATVSAALPNFDPVVLSGTFGRVAPPFVPPAQIDATVKAALPQFPPVSLSGVIAPPAPPVLDPLALSVLPLNVPAVPPLPPIPASLAVSPPVVDPIVTTFAPIVPPVIPPLAATIDTTKFKQELNQRLGETISEWHRRLEELFSQHSGETINEWHRRLADEFGKSFARMVNDTTELRRWLLALAGTKVAPSIDLTKFDQTIQRSTVTASQRFSEWITRLNQLVPQRSGEALNEWSKRIGDFFGQRSGETISEWHKRLRELVTDFHKSFGQMGDDAEELRRFLAGLSGTKLAFDQPPSKITIAEAAQSVPVAAPQLRADAQRQQKEVRNVGLFDGATLNFPEKIDPLHIASEIVWRLL